VDVAVGVFVRVPDSERNALAYMPHGGLTRGLHSPSAWLDLLLQTESDHSTVRSACSRAVVEGASRRLAMLR
jgi:hypothetical protein